MPRQMFEIAIQASIGSKIIARESVKALRKNVTAQMLWRGYYPEEKATGKTKER